LKRTVSTIWKRPKAARTAASCCKGSIDIFCRKGEANTAISWRYTGHRFGHFSVHSLVAIIAEKSLRYNVFYYNTSWFSSLRAKKPSCLPKVFPKDRRWQMYACKHFTTQRFAFSLLSTSVRSGTGDLTALHKKWLQRGSHSSTALIAVTPRSTAGYRNMPARLSCRETSLKGLSRSF
jgi:hypothetical protein